MRTLPQVAHAALVSTSRTPRWWILSLTQVVIFSFTREWAAFNLLSSAFIFWLAATTMVLVPITVWLWLDMDARNSGKVRQKTLKFFINSCFTAGGIVLCAAGIVMLVKAAYGGWVFFALISSLVAATATLAMLFAILLGQNFRSALALALDTWNKKISLAAIVAFVLILGHAVSFALINGVWKGSRVASGFEVLSQSATIWILLLGLTVVVAFCAAVFNCFLVFLFLEIIRGKKDQEAIEEKIAKQALFEAN